MNVLAVDIGTNSSLYLIAEIENNRLRTLERGIVGNKLGSDINEDGCLSPALLDFNQDVLSEFVRKGKQYNCVKSTAVGTHALRNAANSADFVSMSNKIGLPLIIISDREEANLAWKGVFKSGGKITEFVDADCPVALLDIGGGSTELSWGNLSEPVWSSSIPTGAVVATRKFIRNDPPRVDEIASASEYLSDGFSEWCEKLPDDAALVGIAGTLVTLTLMTHGIGTFKDGIAEGKVLNIENVREWKNKLLKMTITQRREAKGMSPARAESIHVGALIAETIFEKVKSNKLYCSDRGLLHGLALKMAEEG